MKNQKSTDWFVLNLIVCPNCNGKLAVKTVVNEYKNVFCEECNFACRFETAFNSPTQSLLSLPTDELERIITDKVTLPPLIIHFKWGDGEIKYERVHFFPFIAYRFLQEEGIDPITFLPESSDGRNIIFSNMFELPHILLYEQPTDDDLAEIVSYWENWSVSFIQRKFQFGYARSALLQDKIKELRRKRGIIDESSEESDDEDESD